MKTVLVPTDFSNECELVWDFAAGLGALGVTRVVLTTVVDSSGLEGPVIAAKVDEARDKLASVASRLEEAGLLVECRVPSGSPFRGLLGVASETHVDAVVCGSHGKRLVDQVFQGSLSVRLIQEGTTPVLMTRYDVLAGKKPAEVAKDFAKRLMHPTDFSEAAQRALETAMSFPASAMGELNLVHVHEPIIGYERQERIETQALSRLAEMHDEAETRGFSATYQVISGDVCDGVIGATARHDSTGIVIGSRGRGAVGDAILGSLPTELMRRAGCPVLVVH